MKSKTIKQNKKTINTRQVLHPEHLLIGFILLATVTGSTMLMYVHYQINQANPQSNKDNRSQFQKIVQPNVFFYSKSFGDLKHTFISLPYKFDQPQIMWLKPDLQDEAEIIDLLVSHPQLNLLDWPVIDDPTYEIHLYQRESAYASVEDFIYDLPAKGIAADPLLISRYKLPATTQSLDSVIDLNAADYILTSYIPSRRDQQQNFYETTLDLSEAKLNDSHEIVWYLQAPEASESSPLYIGEIHIDYRIPNQ